MILEKAQYQIVKTGRTLYYLVAYVEKTFNSRHRGVLEVKPKQLRYFNLLVVIIIMMLISPFVNKAPYLRLLNNIVLTMVLLSAVYTVKKQRWTVIVGLFLGIPWVLSAWIHFVNPSILHPALLALFSMLFDAYVILILLRHIIKSRKITADIIYGSVSVYILLGVFYTSLYIFLEAVSPAPLFEYAMTRPGEVFDEAERIFYFSFVTLTTLGYGDIRPIAQVTRTCAVIEAMTGVLYSAVLIGRLIGLYVAQASNMGLAAEAASKAAAAASAAADAVIAEDSTKAVAAAASASRAASDAAAAIEEARAENEDDNDDDGDDDDKNDNENDGKDKDDNDDRDSKDPGTNR